MEGLIAEGPEQDAGRAAPDRNLALDLVRVTESAAMAAARWVGRGSKHDADRAAVDAMRAMSGTIPVRGVVVIGEGEKDDAPMLFNGERIGTGEGPPYDVAVDPIDGTTLTAKGMGNAVSVLAAAPRGAMFDPSAVFYMDKLVAGPAAAGAVDIRVPVAANVRAMARIKGGAPEDVTVCVLDRPRHRELAEEIRAAGARIRFISDGDVIGAISAAQEFTGVDLLLGVGGAPEAVIAACAIKCLGGVMQVRLRPLGEEQRTRALDAGHDLDRVLTADDLVAGEEAFFAATGITDGELLRGVRHGRDRVRTQSLVMRARSGTVRQMTSEHRLDRLGAYSVVDYRRPHEFEAAAG